MPPARSHRSFVTCDLGGKKPRWGYACTGHGLRTRIIFPRKGAADMRILSPPPRGFRPRRSILTLIGNVFLGGKHPHNGLKEPASTLDAVGTRCSHSAPICVQFRGSDASFCVQQHARCLSTGSGRQQMATKTVGGRPARGPIALHPHSTSAPVHLRAGARPHGSARACVWPGYANSESTSCA